MCQINSEGRADVVDTHSKIFFNRCIFDKHKTLILPLEKGFLWRDRDRDRETEREREKKGERDTHTEIDTQRDRERETEGERDTHKRRERERDWFEMIISTFDIL